MKPITHKDYLGARGMMFDCLICNQEADNYLNRVKICRKCCEETSACQVCGKEIKQPIAKINRNKSLEWLDKQHLISVAKELKDSDTLMGMLFTNYRGI